MFTDGGTFGSDCLKQPPSVDPEGSTPLVATLKSLPIDVTDLVEPELPKRILVESDLPYFGEVLRNPYLLPNVVPFGNDLAVPITDEASLRQIQEQMNSLVSLPLDNQRLPGPNPVSLSRKDIPLLYNLEVGQYWFSYKANGVRWWMLITRMYQEQRVVMINRAHRCLYIQMASPKSYAEGTLLDGELVTSKENPQDPESKTTSTFLFFDVLSVNGIPCFKRSNTYDKRLNHIGAGVEVDLADAEAFARKETKMPGAQLRQAVSVKKKKMVSMWDSRRFVEEEVPLLPYRLDGFVMSPNCGGVRFGQHPRMFKWKLAKDSTLDCLCVLQSPEDGKPMIVNTQTPILQPTQDIVFPPGTEFAKVALFCATNDGSKLLYYTYTFITPALLTNVLKTDSIAKLHNVNLECRLDVGRNLLIPIAVREDRPTPNTLHTCTETLKNIKENVTLDEVLPPRLIL